MLAHTTGGEITKRHVRIIKYHIGKGLLLLSVAVVCACIGRIVVDFIVENATWWIEHWPHPLDPYVIGWGCLVGLVFAVGVVRSVRLILHKSQVGNSVRFVKGECPICTAEEDLLRRGPFVSMLYELLSAVPVDAGSCCVGLYAKWGEGKTSVINLLKEYCAKKADSRLTFIDFSPWKYSALDDLPFRFFLHIAEEIKRQKSMRRESAAFKTLARALRLKYNVSKVGTLGSLVDFVREGWSSIFYGEDDLREELKACLLMSAKRIVVIIDDLDRLPNDDIQKFVTFLKAHADVSGLIFLIAVDEERMSEAVGEMVSCESRAQRDAGRQYLEKIIPISRELPMVNGDELFHMLEREVDRLIASSLPSDVDVRNVNLKMCIPYLQDVRQFKRMLNAIAIDLAFAKRMADNNAFFGFDVGDYIAVSVLREFERDFYKAMPVVRRQMDSMTSDFDLDSSGVDDAWMNEHLYKYATVDGVDACRWFVSDRMGIRSKTTAGQTRYVMHNQDFPEEILGCRFSSRQYFPCYYHVETEGVPIRQSDLNEFHSCINQKKYPDEVITRVNSNNTLPYLLYALEGIPVHDNYDVAWFYIRVLVRISEKSLQPAMLAESVRSFELVPLNIYQRTFRTLFRYLSNVRSLITSGDLKLRLHKNDRFVGDALLPILKEEGAAYMMSEVIRIENDRHSKGASEVDCMFSHAQYAELETEFVALVSERQVDNYVTNHVACFDLLRCWMITMSKYNRDDWRKMFANVNDHCLDDYAALSKILVFFSYDQRAGQDDSLAFAVDVERLKLYWTDEQISRIKKTLETFLKKDAKDDLFLKCLRFVCYQMQVGGDFSNEAQMKYLHGDNFEI